MIEVKFHSTEEGTCCWCDKEKERVYTVTFGDNSFIGPMCKVDLLRAIELKLKRSAKPANTPPVAKPAS